MRLLLLNPNTNAATTAAMVAIAQEAAPPGVTVTGATAAFGAPLITTEAELSVAADAVAAALQGLQLDAYDGVIVSAFGDPGREAAAARLPIPVTGLAEASMAAAGRAGRRFGIATTTPALVEAIRARVEQAGHGAAFTGVRITEGDISLLMADPTLLEDALAEAVARCVLADGAEAVIIGGGPLATAARALRPRFTKPIIEPIPEAVALAVARGRGR